MGGGRKKGKNKKKNRGRPKVKQEKSPVLEKEKDGSDHAPSLETKEDLDALAAAIEATGTTAVKEVPKTNKTKKKRKRNRRRKKSANVAATESSKAAEINYSEWYLKFKKEIVQEEITVLKSMFPDEFKPLSDADLPWQTGCPSFRLAQVCCA